jgi:SAM-dependent methyltransferase
MTSGAGSNGAQFDRFASSYDSDLARGISVSGEDKSYFIYGRLKWLRRCLAELRVRPAAVMEFGCGTGASVPSLLEVLKADSALGIDVSSKSLEFARNSFGSEQVRFLDLRQYVPNADLDLVFCNGVFHHIRRSDQPASLQYVYRCLKPGGVFALWENNPWNPGTRYVMSRIPFDRDAVTLSAPNARRLLQSCGFELLRTDFLFIFPRPLSWLRALEPALSRLPLGAQYEVLARKPT